MMDPYDLLGVTRETPLKEVKDAYYRFARLVHPDKGGSREQMQVVIDAYESIVKTIQQLAIQETRSTKDIPSFDELECQLYCDATQEDMVAALKEKNICSPDILERFATVCWAEYRRVFKLHRVTGKPTLNIDEFIASFPVESWFTNPDPKFTFFAAVPAGYEALNHEEKVKDWGPKKRDLILHTEPRVIPDTLLRNPAIVPEKLEDYSMEHLADYILAHEPLPKETKLEGFRDTSISAEEFEKLLEARRNEEKEITERAQRAGAGTGGVSLMYKPIFN